MYKHKRWDKTPEKRIRWCDATGKMCYARGAAKAAAQRISSEENHAWPIDHYKCGSCGDYHVGHRPRERFR